MKEISRWNGFVMIVAGLVAVGLSGCGKKGAAEAHGQAAGALVQPIADSVEAGGQVLLVHMQADNPVLSTWIEALQKGLDARFNLVVFGPGDISEDAHDSYFGTAPLLEALKAHPDCVAAISTLPMEAQDFRGAPANLPPIFALEWAFPDVAAPLILKGVVPAGVFEFNPAMYPELTVDPSALIAGKYLLLDPTNIGAFTRR